MRSWLNIDPAADFGATADLQADVLVLDLRHTPFDREAVVATASRWKETRPESPLSFLLPPFRAGHVMAAIEDAGSSRADSVILFETESGADIQRLDVLLRIQEIRNERSPREIKIIALPGPEGILSAASFLHCSERLAGLARQSDPHPGSDRARLAAATLALVASAGSLMAIDSESHAQDETTLRSECRVARENGFRGKLTRHPWQLTIINQSFQP